MNHMGEMGRGGGTAPLCVLESFLGPIAVFGDRAGLRRICIGHRDVGYPSLEGEPPPWLHEVASSLRDFLVGREVGREVVERLLASPRLTDFQKRVLGVVAGIPRGETLTYGEVAARIGCPRAARAVGRALGSNPFPLLFPCHRVVRKGGDPGGYGPGVALKARLLAWEGATPPCGNGKTGEDDAAPQRT